MIKRKVKVADIPSSILKELETLRDESLKEKKREASKETVATLFATMRDVLYGLGDQGDDEAFVLAKEILASDLLIEVLRQFKQITFDERKRFKDVLCALFKQEPAKTAAYFSSHPGMMTIMVDFVMKNDQPTALLSLEMLKACLQQKPLFERLMTTSIERLWLLFDVCCSTEVDFSISSNALLLCKQMITDFPEVFMKSFVGNRAHTTLLIEKMTKLITSGSSSQKKKSLELMLEILYAAKQIQTDFAFAKGFVSALLSLTSSFAVRVAPILDVIIPAVSDETKALIVADKENQIASLKQTKTDKPELVNRVVEMLEKL